MVSSVLAVSTCNSISSDIATALGLLPSALASGRGAAARVLTVSGGGYGGSCGG